MKCKCVVAASVIMLAGCREGVEPYSPPSPVPADSNVAQLTVGIGQDRDPSWSPDGEFLLYHTSVTDAVPNARGALMRISADGGTAFPVFADVQRLGNKFLTTPVYSPTADRIAYIDYIHTDPPVACAAPDFPGDLPPVTVTKRNCRVNQPQLDSAVLRVRRVGETQPWDVDASVRFRTEGTSRDQSDFPLVQRVFPFQLEYSFDESLLLRPTWSPDGQRIAFSDGTRIRIWQVGSNTTTILAGSTDGVSPAWSRDGTRIAYTLIQRQDSTLNVCACGANQVHNRWVYTVSARRIIVSAVDGTSRLDLGEGAEPAWSPDGQFIYARRNLEIVRIAYPGGISTVIPNTRLARAPAVSPDGSRLAVARTKALSLDPATSVERFDWDIFVYRLR